MSRPVRIVLAAAAIAAVLLLAGGALRMLIDTGWGRVRTDAVFGPAAVARGGEVVVFAFQRRAYRPPQAWARFPNGGVRQWLADRRCLAVHELAGGSSRLLGCREARADAWSAPRFVLGAVKARGPRVLVREYRRGGADGRRHNVWSTFRLDAPEPERVPVAEHLSGHGQEPASVYLADADGTLVVRARDPRTQRCEPPLYILWLRSAGGDWLRIARARSYSGYDGRAIWFKGADGYPYRLRRGDAEPRRVDGRRYYAALEAPAMRRPGDASRGGVAVRSSRDGLAVGRAGADRDSYRSLNIDLHRLVPDARLVPGER